MAVIKCKMCGGDIDILPNRSVGVCQYCGSTMTLPKIDDDRRAAMFNRGNSFRRAGEFDKALAIYERIVAEDDTDAEAHWCCALCRFGIEYVEDPTTLEYIPTCHRASFESILRDVDYLAAIEHSDGVTRRQYQKDAARIAEVQKGVLAASQNEQPFDVFLCYKETDAVTGERSRDSIDAQDIYYRLTEKGYRVFFSRITLEDKAGTEYEPYIFAALNSAKVMIVLGSRPEHFAAAWVKNEWSRFLALMKKDRTKLLIPCYKNMDPYDLPEQLSVFQSYDMTKIGFIQDLIRGVEKVLRSDGPREPVTEPAAKRHIGETTARTFAAMKRGEMALEDREFDKAARFFDQVLSLDAENEEAYWGMGLAEAGCADFDEYVRKATELRGEFPRRTLPQDEEHIDAAVKRYALPGLLGENEIRRRYEYWDLTFLVRSGAAAKQEQEMRRSFEDNRAFSRALRFARGDYKKELEGYRDELYAALRRMCEQAEKDDANDETQKREKYAAFLRTTDGEIEQIRQTAEKDREDFYKEACRKQIAARTVEDHQAAIQAFRSLNGYRDSASRADRGVAAIQKLQEEEKAAQRARADAEAREARERQAAEERAGIARAKRPFRICTAFFAAATALRAWEINTALYFPIKAGYLISEYTAFAALVPALATLAVLIGLWLKHPRSLKAGLIGLAVTPFYRIIVIFSSSEFLEFCAYIVVGTAFLLMGKGVTRREKTKRNCRWAAFLLAAAALGAATGVSAGFLSRTHVIILPPYSNAAVYLFYAGFALSLIPVVDRLDN